jgi:hypothetical protein
MRYKLYIVMLVVLTVSAADAMAQGRGGRGRGGPPPGRGGFGRGGGEHLINGLQLDEQQRAEAQRALAAYEQTIRQQTLQARTALLAQMQTVLNDTQFNLFRDSLEQLPLVPGIPNAPRGVASSELTQRLLSFDANQDGKIQKEELPERMLNLIEQGDTNSDGMLDRAEMAGLAERNSVDDRGGGGRGGRGRGRGGPPDRGN